MADDLLEEGHFDSWVSSFIDSPIPTLSARLLDLTSDIAFEDVEMPGWALYGSIGDSESSERLNLPTPVLPRRLLPNGLCIDFLGVHIPPDVQAVVDEHFRKSRLLMQADINKPFRYMNLEHITEPALSGMSIAFFIPCRQIGSGGGNTWNGQALPRNPNASGPVAPPKTSRLFGFPTSIGSSWSPNELKIADHPAMRPYSQPTGETLFPSYLREIKSEASGGTIHAAEDDLASAGAHRVNSWLWVLKQLEPTRRPAAADAIVFSDAITQRELVAYVHYFNPKDGLFYMSCIDQFHFRKDMRGCQDHVNNAMDWLLDVQQPMIRDALQRLEPISKSWSKRRPLEG
ncbi:MAG: hypothetical protein M1815_005152 [Lichina confinis]|nr:MAG: hypothetical protein M1815_005152 [Lichina confinis]